MTLFEKIKHREETMRLFCLVSFFAPENIPESLLTSDPGLQDEILGIIYPSTDTTNWKTCETLNSHAFIRIEYSKDYSIATTELRSLEISVGMNKYEHGNYESASMVFNNALQISERVFDVNHIETTNMINDLGITYNAQGIYDEAIA